MENEVQEQPQHVEEVILESLQSMSDKSFCNLVTSLNEEVHKFGGESAFRGLTAIAIAFACLLDMYSTPNPENPEGMCDNPEDFREIFAKMIETV